MLIKTSDNFAIDIECIKEINIDDNNTCVVMFKDSSTQVYNADFIDDFKMIMDIIDMRTKMYMRSLSDELDEDYECSPVDTSHAITEKFGPKSAGKLTDPVFMVGDVYEMQGTSVRFTGADILKAAQASADAK